jgi:hypothetical protein
VTNLLNSYLQPVSQNLSIVKCHPEPWDIGNREPYCEKILIYSNANYTVLYFAAAFLFCKDFRGIPGLGIIPEHGCAVILE